MMIANVHEAKSQLSKLLDAAERGEDVYITRRGAGVDRFQLIPAPVINRAPLFGALKDVFPAWSEEELEEADRELAELMEQSINAPLFPEEDS